jgi:hypothetical protein
MFVCMYTCMYVWSEKVFQPPPACGTRERGNRRTIHEVGERQGLYLG